MRISKIPAINEMALVGGRLCLDFINTTNWENDYVLHERLCNYDDVLTWGCRVGLIQSDMIPHFNKMERRDKNADKSRMADLYEFRYNLRRLFLYEETPDENFLLSINLNLKPTDEISLIFNKNRFLVKTKYDNLCWLKTPVAYSAVELLISPLKNRIKICPGHQCGWIFLDGSPNNRRRWCSMETCGNKSKSQKFYKQKKMNILK